MLSASPARSLLAPIIPNFAHFLGCDDRTVITVKACKSAAMIGFPVDELCHRAYGVDVTMWSPPHLIMILAASFTGLAAGERVLGSTSVSFDVHVAEARRAQAQRRDVDRAATVRIVRTGVRWRAPSGSSVASCLPSSFVPRKAVGVFIHFPEEF